MKMSSFRSRGSREISRDVHLSLRLLVTLSGTGLPETFVLLLNEAMKDRSREVTSSIRLEKEEDITKMLFSEGTY